MNVVTVHTQTFPITTQLPGRVDPERVANVNARVDGVVLNREFEQGANVTNGQVLYEIDPAPTKRSLKAPGEHDSGAGINGTVQTIGEHQRSEPAEL